MVKLKHSFAPRRLGWTSRGRRLKFESMMSAGVFGFVRGAPYPLGDTVADERKRAGLFAQLKQVGRPG
jgi:hypothetical protein